MLYRILIFVSVLITIIEIGTKDFLVLFVSVTLSCNEMTVCCTKLSFKMFWKLSSIVPNLISVQNNQWLKTCETFLDSNPSINYFTKQRYTQAQSQLSKTVQSCSSFKIIHKVLERQRLIHSSTSIQCPISSTLVWGTAENMWNVCRCVWKVY